MFKIMGMESEGYSQRQTTDQHKNIQYFQQDLIKHFTIYDTFTFGISFFSDSQAQSNLMFLSVILTYGNDKDYKLITMWT